MGRIQTALALVATTTVLLGGCSLLGGPASPTPYVAPPTFRPAFGLTWAMAPGVELPSEAFEVSSNPPTGPEHPDTAGHPGHFAGQSIIEDAAASPSGDRLVAVGYVGLVAEWRARSWTSISRWNV